MAVEHLLIEELFVLAIANLVIVYQTFDMFIALKKQKDLEGIRKSFAVPMIIFGIFIILNASFEIIGSTYTLSVYDSLFFYLYIMYSMLFIGLAYLLYKEIKIEYIGVFSFLLGLATVGFGILTYMHALTHPLVLTSSFYLVYGLTAMLAYPVTRIIDSLRSQEPSKKGRAAVFLFIIMLLLGAILAVGIGLINLGVAVGH